VSSQPASSVCAASGSSGDPDLPSTASLSQRSQVPLKPASTASPMMISRLTRTWHPRLGRWCVFVPNRVLHLLVRLSIYSQFHLDPPPPASPTLFCPVSLNPPP